MTMNKPGDGLPAPIIKARDDSDPLSPATLAERADSLTKVLAEWDELNRIARDPGSDPAYPILEAALRRIDEEAFSLVPLAAARVSHSAEIYHDILRLPMDNLDNITAKDNAGRDALDDIESLNQLLNTIKVINARLNPR